MNDQVIVRGQVYPTPESINVESTNGETITYIRSDLTQPETQDDTDSSNPISDNVPSINPLSVSSQSSSYTVQVHGQTYKGVKAIEAYDPTSERYVSFGASAELRTELLQTASAVTPLVLTADAIDDNPGTVLMPDGSTAATASAIGTSDAYACKPGQTLTYTLSTQARRLVFAVYDAAGNLTHGVEGNGYSAYISGEYTFGANDAYFRVSGVTGGNYRKNYALSYSYRLPNAATRADIEAIGDKVAELKSAISTLDSDLGVYDIGTTYNTLDSTYNRVMAVYPIRNVDDTFYYSITNKSTNGNVNIRICSRATPYASDLLKTVATIAMTDVSGSGRFTISDSVKANAKYIIFLNPSPNLLVSFNVSMWTEKSVAEEIKSLSERADNLHSFAVSSYADYEQGGFNGSTGETVNNTRIVRTSDSIITDQIDKVVLSDDNILHVQMYSYDEQHNFIGKNDLGTVSFEYTGKQLLAIRQSTYVKFAIYKVVVEDFSPSDLKTSGLFDVSASVKNDIRIINEKADQNTAEIGLIEDELGVIDLDAVYNTLDATYSRNIVFYPITNKSLKYFYKITNKTTGYALQVRITNAKTPYEANRLKVVGTIAADASSGSGSFGIDDDIKDNASFIMIGVLTSNVNTSFTVTLWDSSGTLGETSQNTLDINEIKKDISSIPETEHLKPNDSYKANGLIRKCYNPYKSGGSRVLVGQMHCHDRQRNTETDEVEFINTNSRAEMLASHKSAGYHWMTVTNYSHLLEVYPTLDTDVPSDFTYLCDSMEVPIKAGVDSDGNIEKIKHVCTFNTHDYENGLSDGWQPYMPLQEYANKVKPNGAMIALSHPYWTATYVTPESLAKVNGRVRFCEVWDGLTEYHRETGDKGDNYTTYPSGKDSDYAWEALIDRGLITWGTAISDVHSGLNNNVIKRGCVKVFANQNDADSILENLSMGNFYASSNVDISLTSVSFSNGVYALGTGSAQAVTKFLGEGGEVLSTVNGLSASYTMTGAEKYVRAVVAYPTGNNDYQGNPIYEKIWTQPVINLYDQDYDNYFD